MLEDEQEEIKTIRATLLRLLSRRDYSPYELSIKLNEKRFSSSNIEKCLNEFIEKKYIDEQRFTENLIYRRQQKGFGPLRIIRELEQFGVKSDLVSDLININDKVWFIQASLIWSKHFKNHLPTDYKSKAKQMRYLQSRGFNQEHIEAIFKE